VTAVGFDTPKEHRLRRRIEAALTERDQARRERDQAGRQLAERRARMCRSCGSRALICADCGGSPLR
jgi:hypothetical protein